MDAVIAFFEIVVATGACGVGSHAGAGGAAVERGGGGGGEGVDGHEMGVEGVL